MKRGLVESGSPLLLALALTTLGAVYEWGGPAARGIRALKGGKPREAVEAFRDARSERPQSAAVRFDQGLAFHAAGLEDSARAAFRAAQSLSGSAARAAAAYSLGNDALRAGRLQEAIESYRTSLREEPGRADAKRNLEEAIRRARGQQSQRLSGSSGGQGAGAGGSGKRQGGSTPPPPGAQSEANSPPSPSGGKSVGGPTPSREEAEHWLDALEAERRAGRAHDQAARRSAARARGDRDW